MRRKLGYCLAIIVAALVGVDATLSTILGGGPSSLLIAVFAAMAVLRCVELMLRVPGRVLLPIRLAQIVVLASGGAIMALSSSHALATLIVVAVGIAIALLATFPRPSAT